MKNHLLIIFLFSSLLGFSQNPNRIFKSAEFQDGEFVKVEVSDGVYQIRILSSEIIETSFVPDGEDLNGKSHAVINDFKHNNCETTTFTDNGSNYRLKTCGLEVEIKKQPFQISYRYHGKPIISEKMGYVKNDSLETIQFNLTKDEILYGGGARALGMNRRGHRLQLYNRAHYGYETHSELMNYTMPIMMSSNQYMIHFDNAPIGFLDLDSKKDNTLTYETISGRKTYQVIVGDSWTDLIDNYTDLTGKQPLPPRWALGNFSSRFGYHSQKEVVATVQKFRDEQIPLDAVIIDIFWFGKDIQGHMGNLEFLKDSFPNPTQMIKDLKSDNINTILVTEPFILTTSKRWQEVVDKEVMAKDSVGNPYIFDFYFGNTGLIDIYNPKGKAWFWDIYKNLADMGVTGVWGDLGEPEVHPEKLLHATGTADEVHNIYGHDWAGLIAEGYKADFPNERPFILMRAGFSGSQRFGMIPWSGDVNRTWGGLQSQPEIALQMGMQGLGYMHSDLGGFAGDNQDAELYTRWLQYGVFQPIYRPHAQEEVPAEPVFWDSKTMALAKKSIILRYKLLPYNYNLSFENHKKGTPLMRPLFFEDDSEALKTEASEYFWGDDFLIAPILNSQVTEKEIYFPKNGNWFDFYTTEMFEGGKSVTVKVAEDHIPTFVRGGAIIPMAKPMQSTKNYDGNTFELHYYYDPTVLESQGQLYNDDGLTADAYEKGQYELMAFSSKLSAKEIEIEIKAELGSDFQTQTKSIELVLHNISLKPKSVKISRKKLDFTYNEDQKTITIPLEWNTSKELKLNIKLN
ncbi:TIM-barrel domain-containing protein [Gelidibacter sp.]|uniref:glycoside hydrolase family 31 protein n=1 Tax=Gelidibacter sp. TaxID=2018083 RepID=UPI002CA641FA|nr:TIM-barrel domain-containing protein [Gelidibacter sp.]HUH27653.1 TIM-barrel domain-containing protein [Gelidibacter sp.]